MSYQNNFSKNTTNFSNKIANFTIILISIAPLIGFFTFKFLDIAFYNFIVIFCYITVFAILVEKNILKNNIRFPTYLKFLTLFAIYTILSDIFIVKGEFNIRYLYAHSLLKSVLILIIINNIKISKSFIYLILKNSLIILVIAFIVIAIQQIHDSTFLVNPNAEEQLLSSSFIEKRMPSIYSWSGGSIEKGFAFLPIIAVFINIYYLNKRPYWLLLIMGFIFALFVKSRWVLVNYFLIYLMFLLYRKIRIDNIVKYALLMIIIISTSVLILHEMGVPVKMLYEERILQKQYGGMMEGSAGTRVRAFTFFAKAFPSNPIFGAGSFKYGIAGTGHHNRALESIIGGGSSQIHVGYLSLFYKYGIIGGILYLSFLFGITKYIYKVAKEANFYGAFIGWLMFLVANLTLVYFSIFNMGIIMILVYNKYLDQNVIKKKDE